MAFRFSKPFTLEISPSEASALYDILKWNSADLDGDQLNFINRFIERMKAHAEHRPTKDGPR